MIPEGCRVLTVRDSDGEHLHIFGEGEYVGDLPRPMSTEEYEDLIDDWMDFVNADPDEAQALVDYFRANPCIHLDNGFVVWGFQCWWGPVEKVRRRFPESRYDYVLVPVPEGNERW